MSEIVDIANAIVDLLSADATVSSYTTDIRFGSAGATTVIPASAVGVVPASKREGPFSVGANQQVITYQVWAYVKPTTLTTPGDSEEAVIELMDAVEAVLRSNPTLSGTVLNSELSETIYSWEQIQQGIYAATAVLNLTVTRMIDP